MTPELRNLARNHLGAYHLAMHRDYQYVRFQQDCMVPALEAVARHEVHALLILLPFRHGKTELGTLSFTSWLFGRYPERKNMVLSYSDTFAKRFGRKIVNLIESPEHQEIFPDCHLSQFARSSRYFTTTAGGEFYSAGFNGTITGQSVNGVLLIDDPLKNREEATSTPIIEGRMEDYRSAANTRLEEGGAKVVITNRWCKNDFVDRLLDEEGEASDGGQWTILCLPAEAKENDPAGRKPGEYLWPERLGVEWYEGHKANKRIWTSMCQQDPQPDQGRFFKREWLCYYPKPIRPGKFPAYMLTDPAKGKDVGHDRTAIGVFVTTPERRILLVDAVLARLDPDERAQECFRLIKKWWPRKWLYEEYGLLSDTWYLEQYAKKVGIRTKPTPVGRKGRMLSKESRIESLIPDFREGRIWFPDPEIPFATMITDGDEEISILDYFIENEYVEYAGDKSVSYDDFLDMLSRLHAEELGLTYPSAPMSEVMRTREYRNLRPAGTSWESVY